jgi:anhydro-N-acetylmuramic acid kinase
VPDDRACDSLYIGLMSGTSMDGIDAALVRFGDHQCDILKTQSTCYPHELQNALLDATRMPQNCTVDDIGTLDHWVGECFRDAASTLITKAGIKRSDVTAIGSHGQTLRHQPLRSRPFTLQIGDAHIIAAGTGIDTIADFRRRDIAVGGQGAPLAPAFHQWLFRSDRKSRCVLNIGGIANITILPSESDHVTGFDTGPGNTLLDSWARRHLDRPYDKNGAFASTGVASIALLETMLADDYFSKPPPKSTGVEYFHDDFIHANLALAGQIDIGPADAQATLAELTAQSIATHITNSGVSEVLVCGGGAHNQDLMQRLRANLPNCTVASTDVYGLHPDWVEAVAFAWLARCCLTGEYGNLPSVTGADSPEILGAIFQG